MQVSQSQSHAESASNLRVVEIDAQNDPRWEAFIRTQPAGLIYHHPAWLQVLEEAYGYKPVSLACEDSSGELCGILPLFYTHGLLSGHLFSSLPRTPVAGPLARDDQATSVLVRAAIERTRDYSKSQLQLKTSSNALDRLMDGVVGTPWRATYVLSLPERPELLRLDARVKNTISKASRLGVQVSLAESEHELRVWYDMYLDTMRRITILPRPYRFFKVAWERLQPHGLMRLLLAKHYENGKARVLAGSLFFMFGQTICYAFAGWRWQDRSLCPNDAIQWRAIQDSCTQGYRWYDFGEVDKDNAGLAAFKKKWGSEESWLYRYYYPAFQEAEISVLESVRHKPFINTAWQRLPLKVTSLLSDWIHCYI